MAKMMYACTSLVCWFCFVASSQINETDPLALIAFKAALIDPFGALSSWNDTLQYCRWNGVICSRRHPNRVVGLSLSSQGLVGSISPHIGNLSFLRSIILQNNSFHGHIPQQIGDLFRLQVINFSNNSFGGEIPNNLSRCSNLRYLNLINNNLTGIIPPELGSLSNLYALGLTKNKLSGIFPPFIGNLSSLTRLSLRDCGLQGEIPDQISQLRDLGFFQISENDLSGKIPSGIFNISTIHYFSVGSNQLQGSIPPDIGFTLPNLVFLDFGSAGLAGMIPPSLSNASSLEEIDLYSNDLTGPVPKDLGRLLNLQWLSFSNNPIQDDCNFISSLANCSNLETFAFGFTLLRGSLPDSIANLSTRISWIEMDGNQLHGNIPTGIENLLNLNFLGMSSNYLSGPIPTVIGKLHKLQVLFLNTNKFTGEIPSSLGNLSLLIKLNLGENNLSGRIPPSLGNCRNLLRFDLSHNNLDGLIPREVMTLTSVSIVFNLAHNSLVGNLPSEVGSLQNLGYLDVSNNRLSGPLPNTLSSCLSLQWLHLESNSFDGEIPQGWSALKGLLELDLSRNYLSGRIPSYLGDIRLQQLDLSFNGLDGEVPKQGVFQNASAVSVLGNHKLCGGVADLKLPPCLSSNSKKSKLSHVVKVIILVVIVVVLFLSTLLVCVFIFLYRRRISTEIASSMPSFKSSFMRLSYAELHRATDGFSSANLIGFGRCGSVYKGIIDQGQRMVAVKVLNLHLREASKSFLSECKALRSIRHRNLLKILSACSSVDFQGNDFKALVYEYMANGSLDRWLHGEAEHQEESRNIKLIERLNIAIDIASGLEYLHYGVESTIVHGDLKPSNVLLDNEMTARIGDFGLAKVLFAVSSEHQSNSVAVKGTVGYVAPEYGMGGMTSTEGDVYSYGILVLEMFTAKKPTHEAFMDDLSLHNFVKNALYDQVIEIVDPLILLEHASTSRIKDCLVAILGIGVTCSIESPKDRMKMGDVVSELYKIKMVYTNGGLTEE